MTNHFRCTQYRLASTGTCLQNWRALKGRNIVARGEQMNRIFSVRLRALGKELAITHEALKGRKIDCARDVRRDVHHTKRIRNCVYQQETMLVHMPPFSWLPSLYH